MSQFGRNGSGFLEGAYRDMLYDDRCPSGLLWREERILGWLRSFLPVLNIIETCFRFRGKYVFFEAHRGSYGRGDDCYYGL